MRRKIPRPYGQSVTPRRLISMLFALAVMWLLYDRLKDPTTWRGFAADDEAISVAVPTVGSASSLEQEYLVPGPNDQDPDEVAAIQELFENV